MLGVGPDAVGRPKVEALAEQLLAFRPELAVTCLVRPATHPDALKLLRRRADLVATCVDSEVARLAVSQVARERMMVHLDIASSVQPADRRTGPRAVRPDGFPDRTITADVRMLFPSAGCVACVGSIADLDNVLYELAAPPDALRRGTAPHWTAQRAGSLITINSIACASGAQLFVDLFAGLRSSYWQRFEWIAGGGLRSDSGAVGAGDECPFCQPVAGDVRRRAH